MLIGLLVGAAALGGGFFGARKFTRERLRFIDAIRHPAAPVVAGITAAAIAWPVAILPVITVWTAAAFGLGVGAGVAWPVAILPVITVWTAAAFGLGVGAGVASGRDKRLPPPAP